MMESQACLPTAHSTKGPPAWSLASINLQLLLYPWEQAYWLMLLGRQISSSLLLTSTYTGPAWRGVQSTSLKPVTGCCWSVCAVWHWSPLLPTRSSIQESYCRGLQLCSFWLHLFFGLTSVRGFQAACYAKIFTIIAIKFFLRGENCKALVITSY